MVHGKKGTQPIGKLETVNVHLSWGMITVLQVIAAADVTAERLGAGHVA